MSVYAELGLTLFPLQVDKSIRTLIDEKLLPQFVAAVEHVPVEVSRAIHQEMLEWVETEKRCTDIWYADLNFRSIAFVKTS